MDLKGKMIDFIGDSITEGCCVAVPKNRFTDRIALRTGAICRNYGVAGTRIARQSYPSDDLRMDRDFCSRIREMDTNADAVVVFGGTNDFGHGDAPFGTDADRTPETFCGALHTLYSDLRTHFPDALIVVLTPMHRIGEDNILGEGNKKVPSAPLGKYVEQIRKTAGAYSFPVLDLYAETMLDPNEDAVRQRYVPDGLHPNDAGHEILANLMIDFLANDKGGAPKHETI